MANLNTVIEHRVVPATEELVRQLIGRMREDDQRESLAMSGQPADWCLMHGFKYSDLCWVGLRGDEPVCVFGVRRLSVLSDTGIPWLLGTDAVREVKTTFLALSKPYVQDMLAGYKRLENWVDARNKISIRWLRWCGFNIEALPKPIGTKGELFHRFWMEA